MISITENRGDVDIKCETYGYVEKHVSLVCIALSCFKAMREDYENLLSLKKSRADEMMNDLLYSFLEECVIEGVIPERTENGIRKTDRNK